MDPKSAVAEMKEEIISLRRDLHMHPETAFTEERTAGIVSRRLRRLGYQVREGVGKTGVVALLDTGRPGPTLAIRADMDALPLQEAPGRPYGSRIPGKMHACGHDGHTAVAMAVATILAQGKDALRGRLLFLFQPAEEVLQGARAMLDDGALRDPRPDYLVGFHVDNTLPAGRVGVRAGIAWAAADKVALTFRGRSSHGALPHLGVDAITMAAYAVAAIQNIVAREVSPVEPAVVSFGTIHGGVAFNIVAESVELTGTLRTFREDVRSFLLERLEAVARGVAAALRGEAALEVLGGCPPVENHPEVATVVRRAAEETVGPEKVVTPELFTVSDDMAFFLREAPGCYFTVGTYNPAKGATGPHHSPSFDIDEDALPIAAEVMVRTVLAYLGGP
jgi:amidohydrolase